MAEDLSALRAAVSTVTARARIAMVGIVVVGVLEAVVFSGGFETGLELQWVFMAARIVTAVLYLRWLHGAYRNVPLLGGGLPRFRPGEAVASFLIPVVNFYRPYQAIKSLHETSDPGNLADPPRYRPASDALYRESAREVIAPPEWRTPFPVRSWWALYLGGPFVSTLLRMGASSSGPEAILSAGAVVLVSVTVAWLGIAVIRSIDARQRERLRRLESAGAGDGGA
jgi:hypothetical protein